MLGSTLRAPLLALVVAGSAATTATAATKGPEPSRPPGDRIVIAYSDDTTAARRAATRDTVDARLLHRLPGLATDVVVVPAGEGDAALAELRARPRVRYAERDVRDVRDHIMRLPNDPRYGDLWGMARIGAPQAWDQVTDASSTLVGVVDTGVALDHEDLAGRLWHNPGETGGGREDNGVDDDDNGYVDDADGWDFYFGVNNPYDNHHHGTHVAGTIGAAGDNGLFVAGVAWNAMILPVAAIGPDGSGFRSDIAAAFEYAAANGARIVNASLGGLGLSSLYRDVFLRHPNTLFVVSAGNETSDDDAVPVTPCDEDAPNVLCVAATDQADQLSTYSNFGARSVDLAAPGDDIVSLAPGGTTQVLSGTSMAAPMVTGVAALALTQHPWLSAVQLRSALLDGAKRLPSLAGRVATGARLDAPAALAAARDADPPSAPVIQSPTTDSWATSAPAVRWLAATDGQSGLAGYDVDLDGRRVAGLPAGATQWGPPPLGDGRHSVTVTARDAEGNRAAAVARTFGIDATAPTAPAPQTPAAGSFVRREALTFFTAPAVDAASGLRGQAVLLDGRPVALDAFGRLAGRVTVADGPHQWSTSAVDNAGNVGASRAVPFTVDDAAPSVSLGGSGRLRIVSGGVALSLRSGEPARATVTLAAGRQAARHLHVRLRHGVAKLGATTTQLGTAAHTVQLRVKRTLLRRIKRSHRLKLRVTITAIDQAGNRRSTVLAGRT